MVPLPLARETSARRAHRLETRNQLLAWSDSCPLLHEQHQSLPRSSMHEPFCAEQCRPIMYQTIPRNSDWPVDKITAELGAVI